MKSLIQTYDCIKYVFKAKTSIKIKGGIKKGQETTN